MMDTTKASSAPAPKAASSPPVPKTNHSCCQHPSDATTTATRFRGLFVTTMILTAVSFGVVTYSVLTEMEFNTAEKTFESIAASALEQAEAIALRKQQGADSLSSALSFAFPSADQWPFVGLRGYTQLATKVALLSASAGHGFMAIVPTEQTEAFEAHAKELYKKFNYPEVAGRSDFGFGIYGIDPTAGYEDKHFHDISGNPATWDNKYNITVPFLQHKNTFNNPGLLMRNLHQFELRGALMENIMECGKQAEEDPARTAADGSPKCGGVTDFTEIFVRPGPSAVFFDPIFPADDLTTVVGFIGTSINWEEVLTNIVPDFVDGIDCVISDGKGKSYTYVINDGIPILLGEGDLHDVEYDALGQDIVLTGQMETGATGSVEYTLTVYPTQIMYASYSTMVPLYASLGLVAVICLCTLVFFAYDHFIKYEAHQRKEVLEVKRRFVRFISHEIRTPLNVVCMGLDLMLAELREHLDADDDATEQQSMTQATDSSRSSQSQRMDTTETSVVTSHSVTDITTLNAEELFSLASEIHENSQNAVTVLNDLLNYDKVESGTFELDFGRVSIFASVMKTVKEFNIQARNRNIEIHTTLQKKDGAEADLEKARGLRDLFVLGDERKINLVVRNLISNALKFCQNHDIYVTISHLSGGLPDADYHPGMLNNDHGDNLSEMEKLMSTSHRAGIVRIAVKDNGVGLNKDQLALLFTEGVQFNAEILQHGGGSGLGLCLTREIVKAHQGGIEAVSEGLGHGSEFYIDLPLYENTTEQTPVDEYTSSTSTTTRDDTHTVLVVDDVLTNTKMLVRLLERAGHKCATASNGQEAVDAFLANREAFDECDRDENGRRGRFTSILMDYEMPEMNGPQATKQLRDLGCKALIFGVTGNVLAEDVAAFKASGADMVLYKPINLPSLDSAWEKMDVSRRRQSSLGLAS